MDLIYIIFILIIIADPSQAGRTCPVDTGLTYRNFYHWCLAYVDDPMSWQEARDYCESQGANLIKIEDASENAYASSLLIHNVAAWIGLHDRNRERKFNWTDGTPAEFFNWKSGEPNNYDNEDCVSIQTTSKWNDFFCHQYLPFICESETVADCCSLDVPNYVIMSTNQTVLGTVVTFSCAEGYYADNGDTTRTCREDETWSGTMPACHRQDCGDPGDVTGATKTGNTLYGDQIVYQCMDGYYLESGNYTLVCDESKTWQGEKPVCIEGIHPSKRIKKATPIHKKWYIYVIAVLSGLLLVVVVAVLVYKRESIRYLCQTRGMVKDPL